MLLSFSINGGSNSVQCMCLGPLTITRYNCYPWWSSPGILHCAVVCPHNVTWTHWWVNGEHGLVGTHDSIHYSLGLLVGSVESYHNPISPPGDSGSRSTSGGAGEGPGLIIISQTAHTGRTWKCWLKINGSQMIQRYLKCNYICNISVLHLEGLITKQKLSFAIITPWRIWCIKNGGCT